jgi:hypothetical protein
MLGSNPALAHVTDATLALAEALRAGWQRDPAAARAAALRAGEALSRHGVRHSGDRTARVVLGAVVVDAGAEARFAALALRLHDLVERAVDWALADPQRLARYFPDHRRMAPWLRRTPGLATWQGYSRYDAILGAGGELRFIELNTGCPGSFHNAPRYHETLGAALREILGPHALPPAPVGIPAGVLPDLLLATEARAGSARDLVAVLNDENGLRFELPLMVEALRARGREAVLADAAELTFAEGRLRLGGRPVSATFNKFRLSTPASPHHCWKPGFEQRYAGFLAGLEAGAMASLNNLTALSVAEDKGLLALLHQPEFQQGLSADDRAFVEAHVAWTARLRGDGRPDSPTPVDVERERADLVVKPANEGRGYRVLVGATATPDQWRIATKPDPAVPAVVQRFLAPLRLPVLALRDTALVAADYFTTLSLAVVAGRYAGCHFRASPGQAVNEALEGATVTVVRGAPS